VISSLETLEALASSNERENDEIVTLKKTLDRLESEKQAKMEGKVKFERVRGQKPRWCSIAISIFEGTRASRRKLSKGDRRLVVNGQKFAE
jgi:hypothetical protein